MLFTHQVPDLQELLNFANQISDRALLTTNRNAEIAYDVLRIDKEPKRSGVLKILNVKENILTVKFSAQLARQLRVAVNGFLEKLDLVSETIETLGPAVSDNYSHY